jgi:hypothetical protein
VIDILETITCPAPPFIDMVYACLVTSCTRKEKRSRKPSFTKMQKLSRSAVERRNLERVASL